MIHPDLQYNYLLAGEYIIAEEGIAHILADYNRQLDDGKLIAQRIDRRNQFLRASTQPKSDRSIQALPVEPGMPLSVWLQNLLSWTRPPFMQIFFCKLPSSLATPSIIASGFTGHPGIYAETGITLSIPSSTL